MHCQAYRDGRCRSCSWLERPYERQLRDKQTRAEACLGQAPGLEWLEPLASRESGFRNRAKMVVAGTVEAPTLGILDADLQGVDLTDCPLYPAALRAVFPAVLAFIRSAGLTPYDVRQRRGELKYVLLTIAEHSGQLMLRFVLRSRQLEARLRGHWPQLLAAVPGLVAGSINLQPEHKAIIEGEQEIPLGPQDSLTMRLNDLPVHLGPQSFFQTNTRVAEALYRQARDWVEDLAPAALWDLYCGVGGFALHCADGRREVLGIERSANAIHNALRSRDELGLARLDFRCADATDHVATAARTPPLVIVNPPRRGLGQALCQALQDSDTDWILYSSCNAESLARDLAALDRFRPRAARVFDMFPHTAHFELACLLERQR